MKLIYIYIYIEIFVPRNVKIKRLGMVLRLYYFNHINLDYIIAEQKNLKHGDIGVVQLNYRKNILYFHYKQCGKLMDDQNMCSRCDFRNQEENELRAMSAFDSESSEEKRGEFKWDIDDK